MSLTLDLQTHAPILWINSHEPHRVLDFVLESPHGRKVVYFDELLSAAKQWDPIESKWLLVAVPSEPNEDGTVNISPAMNIPETVEYCHSIGAIFLVYNAHLMLPSMITYCANVASDWVHMVRDNNADTPGVTFVAVAPDEEKFPKELLRYTLKSDFELPNPQEIRELVDQAMLHSDKTCVPNPTMVVRAAQGLSEFEIYSAINHSIADHNRIDATAVAKVKMKTLARNGLLEVRRPSFTLDQIGGLDLAKDLIETVAYIWNNPDTLAQYDIKPIRRIMMIGVPGTGKSMICDAAANALGVDLAIAGVSKAMSKFVGESESNMRAMFAQLDSLQPICMWVDEIGRDLSGAGSSNVVDGGTTDRVHAEFLTGLQELPAQVFLIAAANSIAGLPPEMLRADRFDKFMFVGMPTMQERRDIFKVHLGAIDAQRLEANLDAVASASAGFTGAEIKALITSVRFQLVKSRSRVKATDLISAMKTFRGRIWTTSRPMILDMYKRALTEWDWASSQQFDEAAHVIDIANGKTTNHKEWALA